jgi:pilus assembly protein CpaB
MRARTLILLLFAVLLAGGTAFLVRSYLDSQKTAEIPGGRPIDLATPAKSVLVARGDIKRGQILRADDMIWQVWPEGSLDKNYVVLNGPKNQKPESFTGWVARNPIGGGEPITESRIIAPGNRGFLAAVLRPGTRAISVPVTVTSGISGFIFPGDQVDLLITYTVPAVSGAPGQASKGYDHKVAETVLRNVRVIAIDQRLESKAGEAVPAHTATFEVTPKQSEVIMLASEIGKVSLSLRSLVPAPSEPADSDQPTVDAANQNGTDSSIADLASYTLDSEISPLLPKAAGSKEASDTAVVTILRGGGKGSESAASQPAIPAQPAQSAAKGS